MGESTQSFSIMWLSLYMSRFANNALLGGGVRVRVWIREQTKKDQKKIKGTTKLSCIPAR